jgi:hypothetical protein
MMWVRNVLLNEEDESEREAVWRPHTRWLWRRQWPPVARYVVEGRKACLPLASLTIGFQIAMLHLKDPPKTEL